MVINMNMKTNIMKVTVIKLMGLLLLAGFLATGCERTYYVGTEHRHHDNGLHLGDRHNHNRHKKYHDRD